MRKIIIGLALLTIFAAPLAASALITEGPKECCVIRRAINLEGTTFDKDARVGPTTNTSCPITATGLETVNKDSANWGIVCLLNTFNGIVDWMFTILILLAVFFTILGAFNIIMAGGKAENVTTGKDYILYAAIGLAVALLARALPGIVKAVMGY